MNDVLTAIRTNHLTITDVATTKTLEAASVMLQGVAFANIALNYDQGFVVTEVTDLAKPLSLPLVSRAVMRDSAVAKFDQAIALMGASPFAASPSTGGGRQRSADHQRAGARGCDRAGTAAPGEAEAYQLGPPTSYFLDAH